MQWRPLCRLSASKSGNVTAAQSGEGDAKDAALHSRPAPPGLPKKRWSRSLAGLVIPLHCQLFTAQVQFLTRMDPVSMVRAALGGGTIVILPEPSRVSKAWPTTHAKKVLANNSRLTRLRSPRGLSVSANDSAASMLTVLPKAARINVRPPIRRRSPAVFGSRLSSWPGLWLVRRSAGFSIAGSESRLGG